MSGKCNAFVTSFDLFSKPFMFFVGDKNNKNKATFIGGLLSLSVLSVSIIYFYYLINMYFGHKVEPKITSSISIESSLTELEITENFFIFEMLINGEPLNQYQKRVGKVFLTYSVNYEVSYSNGTFFGEVIPFVDCTDQQFKGFLCIEDKDIQKKNIALEPILQNYKDISLEVNYCNPLEISNCASPEEIQSTIFAPTNYFQVFTKIHQYNPSSRTYENGYKAEYFYFDPYNTVFTRISLIKATTTVKEGFLIQSSQSSDGIYDFKRIDSTFSRIDIEKRTGISGIAYILFEINQVRNIIMIQHAMITEILAQFMSIFNALLIVGIIAQMFAQTDIVEDMNNILLKEYFKKSALALVGSKQGNQYIQKQDSMEKQFPDNMQDAETLSHEIALLQKKINKTNFTSGEKKYFNFKCMHSTILFFHKLFGKKMTINKTDSNQNNQVQTDSMIYQQLLNQSVRGINIYEVYKDIIKLKMAIKIMLTKEQYAAIQFCGSEILSPWDNRSDIELKEPNGDQNSEQPVDILPLILSCNENITKKDDMRSKAGSSSVSQTLKEISETNLPQTQNKNIIQDQNRNIIHNFSEKEDLSTGQQHNCSQQGNDLVKGSNILCRGDQAKANKRSKKKKDANNGEQKNQDEEWGKRIIKSNQFKLEIEDSKEITQVSQKSHCSLQNVVKLQTDSNFIAQNDGDNNLDQLKLVTQTDEEENPGDDEDDDDDEKISTIQNELQKNSNNNNKFNFQGEVIMHEINRKQKEKNKLFNFNSKISHLSEMDLIDDDPGLQEELLKQFLLRFGQTNSQEIVNHVDKQIFHSLISSTQGIQTNNKNIKIQSTRKNEKGKEQRGQQDQEYQLKGIFSSLGTVDNNNGQNSQRLLSLHNNISSPKQQLEEKHSIINTQLDSKSGK